MSVSESVSESVFESISHSVSETVSESVSESVSSQYLSTVMGPGKAGMQRCMTINMKKGHGTHGALIYAQKAMGKVINDGRGGKGNN